MQRRAPNTGAPALRSRKKVASPLGFTLIEMLVSLAIILIMAAVALPYLYGNRRAYHLTQASTAAAGAIQATRYKAIMTGCPYSIAFTAGSTNYQVQTEALTGTPPACATTWSNVGNPTPWATSSDVSVSSTVTLQFCPNGTQTSTASSPPCPGSITWGSLQFSNGFTTNTVTVSGVGNVNVSQP